MESNNHFNYTHSSANSGLKLSSGDSLYTNGSSMSFPQQGKNMNGEMNVNGVTTVLGSAVPGSHPPTAPYPHMSNHHQSSMGYDYLWGGHPQYGPGMGASPGHGMHQKQPAPGMVQPQSQHHFQGHGQYQLNGGIESSHQPPVAGPANMPLSGSQYWNRSNPGPQQISYNSHSMYGTYQSQAHPGITPSQHHQQQSLQPPPHQPSQQHLQSHRHPPQQHHQQHQQPQHYGMMPNGMPYYQHQPQHPSLPSPQQQPQQPPPQQSQAQGQAQMMPPAAQNFTPPRGSPQHHSLGRGSSGSPLPVGMSSATMMSPSTVQESGSPKDHSRERSPHASNVGIPTVIQGHAREAVKETDSSYNGMERASAAQRLSKSDSYQPKPVGPSSDYRPHSEQPAAQRPEMASSVRESAMNTPPQFVSSQLSASASPAAVSTSLNKDSTRPRVSAVTAVSESPTSAPRPPVVSSPDKESAPPQTSTPPNVSSAPSPAAPPRLSSPPQMMQGLRPEMTPVGSKHLSVGASSSPLPASPPKLSTPLASTDSVSRPISSVPPVSSPSFESHQTKSSLPPTTLSPPALVSTSSYSASGAISSLQQMVQGSRPPLVTSGAQHEKSGPPKLMSAISSMGAKSSSAGVAPALRSSASAPTGSCLSTSASPMSASTTPSVGGKPCDPAPTTQHETYTPLAANSGLSTASAASLLPGAASPPSLAAHESPTVRPLSTLPLLTTQASRTAPVSAPPALVSVPPAMGTSSGVVQSSDSEQHPPNATPPQALKQSSPKPEHHGHSEDRKANERNGKPEEHFPQLDSGTRRTSQKVEATETSKSEIRTPEILSDLPYKPLQTTVAPDQSKSKNKQADSEKHQSGVPCESEEQAPLRKSSHLHSTGVEDLTDEESFDDSSLFDTPSRIKASSFMEKSSFADDESSRVDDSKHYDSSFHPRKDTSFAEEETSTAFDTTKDSSFSVEDSRDDTLDSTREGETSEAEETKDGSQITGESMLESSLNNTSQVEDPSDASDSRIYVPSQPSRQGPEAEWEHTGHDAPDSAGRISIKTTVSETMTPPSFKMRDENFIAFSTPAEGPAVHPLQPVTDQAVSAIGGHLKTPGKPRKPRTPKAIWMKSPAPEETQRKPRVRTPKVEKTNDEGVNKGEVTKGRKRKQSVKVDVQETSDASGETGPATGEVDSITATIEAVLANASAIDVPKPKKARRMKKQQEGTAKATNQGVEKTADDVDENDDDDSTAGESNRRRVATEEQVQFPLQHGWRREIRVKKMENRMKGETWYYTPCGRRMKQFPEIIKYLKKHSDSVVTREHFSFSPRMPVGDFYEERESPEGMKWVLLANEEVPSMIMAITGRRGRPPNPDKEKPRRVRGVRGGPARRPGRPPKPKMIDLLSKVDAKLLKRLEAKEALTEEEKEKLAKIKKKMKRKARMKRREDTKIKKMKAEKKKAKLEQDARVLELKAEPTDPTQVTQPTSGAAAEPKKPGRRRSVKVVPPPPPQQTDEERIAQGKRVLGARSKAKALAKAQAEAEAAARAALAAKRAAERRAQAQRRLEERKRQQLIAEELKKPTEDMCLTDHKPLPELSRIPGVVLSGTAFAHCLAVVEFLHGYGKVIGLNIPKDIPSLATLQEGLLGLGDGQGEVQDLLIKLVEVALHDPGLSSYYQSVKILGDKLAELELTRGTVSEVLRIFLESHGFDTEVCNMMRTKPFHALPPDTKAAILGFLVDELSSSNIVTSDIDNTLENMATYRKNKWIIEGKLRKLKAALARRTGRSEEELCFEERRRSARVAEEENLSLEESGLIVERGNRRARKEEPKLSDSESPTNASIPELERQIDKLTKRQAFFRKKLLQSSHSMRATLLGQDRYRRRYLALPHLGGVLVEGPEELLTSGDVLVAEVPVSFLKKEPKVEEIPMPTTPPPTLPSSPSSATPAQPQTFSPEDDPLPGTASLMSRPRGRGRPRKIKPEVELHLRTAKIRRRRRSSVRSCGEDGPGSPNSGSQDLTQAAFQNWLSQSQEAVTNGTCSAAGDAPEGNRPEESVKEMAEKQGQWFNLLPKQPCDDNSLTEPQIPNSPGSPPKLLPQIQNALPALAVPLLQPDPLMPAVAPADPLTGAPMQDISPTAPDAAAAVPGCAPPAPPQLLPAPISRATPAPATPGRPGRRRRRGSRGSSPARRGPRGAAAKRRGRPPNSVFQELEQQYFTQLVVKPIPASMVRGWWWIKEPEELYNTLQALHPRGVREKVLHKHLAKHMESLAEMCTKPIDDRLFELKVEEKDVLMEALQEPWQVQERTMETDISALQWVEDLEQRVVAADLHLKALPQGVVSDAESNMETPIVEFQPYTIPDPDSTRDDLQYYEHDADPHDDWIVRTKKEWSGLPRIATHPVDLAVLRLANLERNIERRYLKEPLWNIAEVMRLAPLTPTPGDEQPLDVFSLESEITSRMRTWRQALDRVRSAPQVCLCLLQLEKAIAWERSVTKVTCQVCRKGDNDDCLLLCDSCDRGCHMYCLRPKITQVPEGDWFCPACIAEESDAPRACKKRTRMRKRRYEDDSSEDETTTRRSGGMATRYKETPAPSSSTRNSGEGSAAKRRRMTTRNQPDLTFCEIILMEMEAHAEAWPFLEPVNPRLVPGYRRIIKNPMDFLTMRERLLQGGYCSCEEFAADAHLVFNNCELFNEDTSEVGIAGHAMRRFFESRWAEFYSNRDK
ncbi:bromodomain adjacent to zinc finger domain protein 2A isoform X2 [Pagrus major]|uniref:bromodomain adjacent to zinc finger domain protein 2A isoform X2 n=1 Tax=Pagrus major TaxID=143350 RepID=UPI003CC88E27